MTLNTVLHQRFRLPPGRFISTLLLLTVILHLPAIALSLPDFSISGYEIEVKDAKTNEPMIGVSVYTKDQKFTGITDLDGKLSLGDLAYNEVVVFSYVGYKTRELKFITIRNLKGKIFMEEDIAILQGVEVVGRKDDPVEEIPFIVDRITSKDIAFGNAQTAADAISKNGEVFVQKSQMGGGSPIVRGFEANKVLMVVDGVRMNNAIYRGGHLQNAITVDNSTLEQIELIYGPGSLMYGSDAIGGVIHFRTKDPTVLFSNVNNKSYQTETNVFTRYATANQEKTVHLDLDYGTRRWGSLTSFSYSDFGDLKAGTVRPAGYESLGARPFYFFRNENVDEIRINPNPEVQIGTAYSQIDFMQKIKYQASDYVYYVANFQYSTTSDVPRYDNLTDTLSAADKLKWAEWNYGPQKRLLASLKMRSLKPTALYDKASIIGAYQRIDEDRLQRKYADAYRSFSLADVQVASFTLDFDKHLDQQERNLFSYGIDVNHNIVNSLAGRVNIKDGTTFYDEFSRYPSGGSTVTTYAGYATYRWKSKDSTLNFNAGARYTMVNLFSKFKETDPISWPTEYITGLSSNNSALTWGTGITWNSKSKWQVRMLASTAFRSPNLDDFSKIREKGGFITIPNPSLTPEYSLNGEFTLAKEFGEVRKNVGTSFKISGTGFYTELTDAIVRTNFALPDGSEILDEFQVQANINAEKANVYGVSGHIVLNIKDKWRFRSSLNYVKGIRLLEDGTETPLAHIPPMYGTTSLGYEGKKVRVRLSAQYNAAKPLEEYDGFLPCETCVTEAEFLEHAEDYVASSGSSDNIERATIDGSLAWLTYNLHSTYQFSDHFSLDFAVENITDIHYRTFASGVSAAGRNFIFALRGKF
ncbi:MAG: TonB-dependent receptor [Saprospiraceae bacterium]